MGACPACASEVPGGAAECPACKLSVELFGVVREAAGPEGRKDPVFMQTVGELLRSVDLTTAASTATTDEDEPPQLLDRGGTRRRMGAPADRPARSPDAVAPLDALPSLPPRVESDALRRRLEEYSQLGRRLGVDLSGQVGRAGPAALVADDAALETIVREMFVRLASTLAEEYERTLGRRNELAQLVPTTSADVEFAAIRGALSAGDLAGAFRRLDHVREQLSQVEEDWATGRILATECDLLAETLRELGGDPGPALGPLQEGRKYLGAGRREPAERMLARSAIALWSLLKPRFMEELKRLRDRILEAKSAGLDIAPAIAELRSITVELKARNFVGTIGAYRHLKAFADRAEPAGAVGGLEGVPDGAGPAPSA
ncbi:MAG TPA: hypothetical protein VML94_01590 [Thermoplasmata archaeon]|nr:hypothetical protein [Thermoplasmata archaeon]